MGKIVWNSPSLEKAVDELRCEQCGSELIVPSGPKKENVDIKCKSCGYEEKFEDYVERALADHFQWENYLSHTDGGEPGLITCPSCSHESYIWEENFCPICETGVERECRICSADIIPSELDDDGLCGYCRHISQKDD